MKTYAIWMAATLLLCFLSLSPAASYAGRDGAQLMLQDQLNKRAAGERQTRQPTQDEVRACQNSARRTCPTEASR